MKKKENSEVTAEHVRAIQDLHKRNPHVSAVTVGNELGLTLSPVTIVRVIEGDFNHLLIKN
jgi:hypothetical protein